MLSVDDNKEHHESVRNIPGLFSKFLLELYDWEVCVFLAGWSESNVLLLYHSIIDTQSDQPKN